MCAMKYYELVAHWLEHAPDDRTSTRKTKNGGVIQQVIPQMCPFRTWREAIGAWVRKTP